MTSRWKTAIAAAALMLFPAAGQAQVSDDVVRIAVMNDRSGAYADFGGEGSVAAARIVLPRVHPFQRVPACARSSPLVTQASHP